jgi:hypothetical protein
MVMRQRMNPSRSQRLPRHRTVRERMIPYLLIAVVLIIAATTVWWEWQDRHRVYTLRVVDTRTGDVENYPVYRDGVRGRGFTTIDGRVIQLADIERMELVEQ